MYNIIAKKLVDGEMYTATNLTPQGYEGEVDIKIECVNKVLKHTLPLSAAFNYCRARMLSPPYLSMVIVPAKKARRTSAR